METIKERSNKKRNNYESQDKDMKRKRLCNTGQEYTTRKGKLKRARRLKAGCKCKLQCSEYITDEMRKDMFTKFWNTGSHVKQWQIITKYVVRAKKKTASNLHSENVRRLYTLHYHLPIKSEDGIVLHKVCQTMFLNTFGISEVFVYTALRKKDESKGLKDMTDKRGRHKNRLVVITEEMKQSVLNHVNSFKPVKSRYIRKQANTKYLDSSLSFVKMFEMYGDWCNENNYNTRVQTVRQYRDVVNANFKIRFNVTK